MSPKQVLEELPKYQNKYRGCLIANGYSVEEVRDVIAAPYNLSEFTSKFIAYTQNSEQTVSRGLSNNYTIYFIKKPRGNDYFPIRLDEFESNYRLF